MSETTNVSTITDEELHRRVEGATIGSRFVETARSLADRTALRWKDDDGWHEWTFSDYLDRTARVAAAYADLGVGPGDRIVLMVRNIPEFHVLDMAAYFVGATPISIYNSSSADQVRYLTEHSGACLAVVEDEGFLARFDAVRDDLPALRSIIAIHPPAGRDDLLRYEDLLGHDPCDLEAAAAACQPDDLATIIYTSGTTGPPKGVMLTHRNICWTVESLRETIQLGEYVGKRLVSYLPMAHIAERVTSHYQQAMLGFEVSCCPDPSQVAAYAGEVRPNVMFGVPRVWEKIYAGVTAALAADPEKGQKFEEAVAAARPIVEKIDWGTATEEEVATWNFLDEVAFSQVRQLVGLDQLDLAITGAAPIPAELLGWFRAIGVPLSEIYGLSESSGPMTFTPTRVKAGTVGPAIAGCDVRLAEDGEVICRGGNIFAGYLDNADATAFALQDGWLHTGDIGEIDDDGYLRIVDRKKELIITAGGKNISPANLEAALKLVPLVGQACVIGDQRPFVSALVVLDPDVAPVWARQHGIEDADDLQALADHPDVVAEVERGVAEVMEEFNNAERVKKVRILGEEWLPDSELLTPTSKLKRRGVHARYADEIGELYA
ncbi:AMP-dependent synthetase/ligase [Actinomarinicola tropica]|uniref:AMP-dependent synthetase/ligase n=1 Tax=Actinomarinicola tropica TaxID=2789776 RepID=UPI001E4903FA|nr:AMP-dependent synthetase/ligase [Actinomarinicola tropica]